MWRLSLMEQKPARPVARPEPGVHEAAAAGSPTRGLTPPQGHHRRFLLLCSFPPRPRGTRTTLRVLLPPWTRSSCERLVLPAGLGLVEDAPGACVEALGLLMANGHGRRRTALFKAHQGPMTAPTGGAGVLVVMSAPQATLSPEVHPAAGPGWPPWPARGCGSPGPSKSLRPLGHVSLSEGQWTRVLCHADLCISEENSCFNLLQKEEGVYRETT